MQLKETSVFIRVTIALLDLILVTLAFQLSFTIRFGEEIDYVSQDQFIWLYYFSAPLILFLLLQQGALTGYRHLKLRDIVKSTVVAFVLAGAISSTVLYLSKAADYNRLLFGQYFLIALMLVLAEKVIVKKLFDRHLRRGWMNVRVAMVGFGDRFEQIRSELLDRPQWGIKPTLALDPRERGLDDLVEQIKRAVVDEVYVAYPRTSNFGAQLDALLVRLERMGLPVRVALNFDELQPYYGQHACNLASARGVMLAPHNLDPDQLALKRCLDIVGSVVGLLILAILMPFLALAIKLDSPGPLFFSQQRIGKGH